MHIIHKQCAHPGCHAPAGRVRCQDCGRAFCAVHVAATEFAGRRAAGALPTVWTRFVCGPCADRAERSLFVAAATAAADDARAHWWDLPRAAGEAGR